MIEHSFRCPYCWESISMLLEVVQAEQEYIEDCEVCCRPIQLNYLFSGHELTSFSADEIGQ